MNSLASCLCPSQAPQTQLLWEDAFGKAASAAQKTGLVESRAESSLEMLRLIWLLIRENTRLGCKSLQVLYSGSEREQINEVEDTGMFTISEFISPSKGVVETLLEKIGFVFKTHLYHIVKNTASLVGIAVVATCGVIYPTGIYVHRHPPKAIQYVFDNPDSLIPGTNTTLNNILDRGIMKEIHNTVQWVLPTKEPSKVNPCAPLLNKPTALHLQQRHSHTIKQIVEDFISSLGLQTNHNDMVTLSSGTLQLEVFQKQILSRSLESLASTGNQRYAHSILKALEESLGEDNNPYFHAAINKGVLFHQEN